MDISIIVPVGRPQSAYGTILSILEQSYLPSSTEIILVGADLTLLKQKLNDERIHFLDLPCRCSPSKTRIAAVNRSHGLYYLFIDDDIEIEKQFFEKLWPMLSGKSFLGAVGPRLPGKMSSYYSKVTDFTNFWAQQSKISATRNWLYSAVLAVPAQVYHEVGGFDPDLEVGEDVDLTTRIRLAGYVLYYEALLVGYHDHKRVTFGSAVEYFWQNGRLAKYQFAGDKRLRVFSFRRAVLGSIYCLWNTIRCNIKEISAVVIHIPGIILMYIVFNLSLEFHRQKYMKAHIAKQDIVTIKKLYPDSNPSYLKMLIHNDAGNVYRSFMYLILCHLKELLIFIFPVFISLLLYLLLK